ncbi:MAG: hypothetical protein CM15mP84_09580 [Cellvibrionales bacterium]|nr:MAG: hypothetical protein CM15mP84_09580 [Cellvibrionales bacterium]
MLEALASHERGTPEAHKTWIRQLLTDYYDPMYEYQMNKRNRPPVFRGNEGTSRSIYCTLRSAMAD